MQEFAFLEGLAPLRGPMLVVSPAAQVRSLPTEHRLAQSPALAGRSAGHLLDSSAKPLILAALCAAAVPESRRRRRTDALRRSSAGQRVTTARQAGPEPGRSLSLFSPAKVNLFLRVIRKRTDGYHDLASLFQTVSLGDKLNIEVLPAGAAEDELQCNLPGVPVDGSNLVIRALNLFRARSGLETFFRICLEKSIPAQAGMGGGSSNAATAFYGANALCGHPATQADLLQWADDPVIGSDASFFLSEGTAYCTGRGEIVEPAGPLPVPDGQTIYLVKPRYGLSTPKVFQALDLDSRSSVDPEELLNIFKEKGVAHSAWVNDLEQPAFEVCPDLGKLKAFLASSFGFRAVLMSGSGTTIYCLGEPEGGRVAFEEATRRHFDIEGIWQSSFVRRADAGEWYKAPAPDFTAAAA